MLESLYSDSNHHNSKLSRGQKTLHTAGVTFHLSTPCLKKPDPLSIFKITPTILAQYRQALILRIGT